MADIVWGGTVSTDVGDATNWVGGVRPTTSDNAVWNSKTPFAMASGTMNAGVTDFIVTDGTGTLSCGTAGGTFTLKAVTGKILISNRAPAHWINANGVTVALTRIESPVSATIYLQAGTFTTVQATNVTIEIVAAAIVVNVIFTGATINAAINGTGITLAQGTGFINSTSRNIATCKVGRNSTVALMGTANITSTGDFQQSTLVFQSSATVITSTIVTGISLFSGSLMTFVGNPNSTAGGGGAVVVYPGAGINMFVPGCTVSLAQIAAGPTSSPTVSPTG